MFYKYFFWLKEQEGQLHPFKIDPLASASIIFHSSPGNIVA